MRVRREKALFGRNCMKNSVLEYLRHCVEAHPQKRAVACRDHSMSFAELDQRARQYGQAICRALPARCAPRPIGVLCARDVEPIAALLGVVYSRNFYVPLDSSAPKEKLKAILEDAEMQLLLGSEADRALMQEIGFSGTLITPQTLAPPSDEALPCGVLPDGYPLYMVYTSGSTGKPKGVLKSHQAEISFLEAFCETFPFSETDVIGNQTPFFFDAAAKDIYLMLKKGITMEIIPTECFALPTELIQYLNQKRITVASWVPTVLSIVAQLNPFSEYLPETLKRVFFVGEVMPMKHLNVWRRALPQLQYINLYGQSELCGICCYYEVKGTFADSDSLPMGVGLKNCKLYLLDQETVVTEPGRIGELYLVSDALATEYYHDPEKTRTSFVTKDFGDGPVRCFKTGDLAQYDQAGNLIFAARSDFQIKHMGHRIELGEIETVAGALPEIARCCCLYHSEKKKIVLFCEPTVGCNPTGAEIKSRLKTRLSSYMVPWKVVVMERLPLNANGKLDRQALKTCL